MKLIKTRVRSYFEICDTGEMEVLNGELVLSALNFGHRTRIQQALLKLNPSSNSQGFDPRRDYPRSEYVDDIERGNVFPGNVTVIEGHFSLDPAEIELLNQDHSWEDEWTYVFGRTMDNYWWHRVDGNHQPLYKFGDLRESVLALSSHAESRMCDEDSSPSELLYDFSKMWTDETVMIGSRPKSLSGWASSLYPMIELETDYHGIYEFLMCEMTMAEMQSELLDTLRGLLPVGCVLVHGFRKP